MNDISIVILSGGKSTRMGTDKAKLRYGDQTFVERIYEEFSDYEEVLFSVRGENDFPEVKIPHIMDFYPGCGPMAGIHSALYHSRNPWVFLVACDMPFVKKSVLDQMKLIRQNLLSKSNDTNHGRYAIIPISEDGRLQVLCALYHKDSLQVFEKMLSEGRYRMRDCLSQLEVTYVPVEHFMDHAKVFANINTFEDYKEMNK